MSTLNKLLQSSPQCSLLLIASLTALSLDGDSRLAADDAAPPNPQVDLYGDPLPRGAIARLGTVRYRNCDGSGRMEFLADGQTLLGCNGPDLVWLDVTTGEILKSVTLGESDTNELLAISQDRSLAAFSGSRRTETGEYEEHTVVVRCSDGGIHTTLGFQQPSALYRTSAAEFSSDGAQLVTGDYKGVLRTWDVATGQLISARELPVERDVTRIAISPDGSFLIACSYEGAYRWNWKTNSEFELIEGVEDAYGAQFTATGDWVIVSGHYRNGGLHLFDGVTGQLRRRLSVPKRHYYSRQFARTADGARLIATSSFNYFGQHPDPPGQVEFWDVESGELLQEIPFHTDLGSVALSPDERRLVVSSSDSMIAWDVESMERYGESYFGHHARVTTIAVSPDGAQALTGSDEGWAILWDLQSQQVMHVLEHHPGEMVRGLAFSGDGRWLATSALDDSVRIWNRDNGERAYTLYGHGEVGGRRYLAFSPDSRRLLSFGDDWFLRVFDVQTGKALLEHAIRPSGAVMTNQPDGTLAGDDLQFFDMAARFTSDGSGMFVSLNGFLYLFNVETGTEQLRYEEFDAGRISNSFPISFEADRAIGFRRESLPNGSAETFYADVLKLSAIGVERSIELIGHRYPQLTMSSDGELIAAVSSDTVSIYAAGSGIELARIELPIRAAWAADFSPNGDQLLIAHRDATVLVWDWRQFLLNEQVGE